MKELSGSIRILVRCPVCFQSPAESWPLQLFVFPDNPLALGLWHECAACHRRIPWDQWLVAGGDFDITAIGPIGGLPTLGDALNTTVNAPEPPPPPKRSEHGGYLVKGPACRRPYPDQPS